MTQRASDYRYAGRMAASDKSARKARQAVEAVEDSYITARDAYHDLQDAGSDTTETYAAYQAATDALRDVGDPNGMLL